MHGIWIRVWRYRWWYATGMLVLVLVDAIQTALPFLVRTAIDDLAAGSDRRLGGLVLAMLAIAAAMVGLRYLWRVFIVGAARRIRRDMRAELHLHLLRQDAGFHRGRTTGELVALAGNDLDAVAQACGFGLLALFDALFMAVFALGAMLHLDPRLAALACIPAPLIALVQWRMGRAIHHRFETVQASFGELTEQVREALSGIRTVKAHAREAGLERCLAASSSRNLEANLGLARLGALFDPLIALLAGGATVIVLYAGGSMAAAGTISLGDLVAFLALLGLMSWPMIAIGWSVNLLSRGSASMARIMAVMSAQPLIADPASPQALPDAGGLSLRGLTVRYPGSDRDALQAVDAELPAGAVLGLVGGTGSGKSTLAQALVRLVDPTAGEVRLGGTRISELRLADLRRAVALVPQEATVFALTVHDNIAFAAPGSDAAAVEAAARAVGLHDEIAALPAGYQTMLGERGINFSGGQRQRLAIARAILAAPRLLVLDDCLSALDAATSGLVLGNLRASRAGLTTVVISHRLRTLADADLILVLDRGRVSERGTHASLVAGGGFYARLHALQQAEQAVEERA